METEETKRKRIEEIVEKHPQFSKVAQFVAKKYGKQVDETKRKFIDFLLSERYYFGDGVHHNVLCFEFDESKDTFVNRTIFTPAGYPF